MCGAWLRGQKRLWTADGSSGGTGRLGGAAPSLNGAQLHTAAAITALNRCQLLMGRSDESCTLATPHSTNRKRVGERMRERGDGRQKEEEEHGQEDKSVAEEKRGESLLCKTRLQFFLTQIFLVWRLIKLHYETLGGELWRCVCQDVDSNPVLWGGGWIIIQLPSGNYSECVSEGLGVPLSLNFLVCAVALIKVLLIAVASTIQDYRYVFHLSTDWRSRRIHFSRGRRRPSSDVHVCV